MPRTACRNSGLAGSRSILRRSRLICTSTARSLTVPSPVSALRGTVSPARDGENAQHLALAIGEMDDLLALAQFAALEMIDVGPERDLLQRLHRRRRGALEDIADPQAPARAARTAWRHNRRRRSAGPRSGLPASWRAVSMMIGTDDEVRMKRARSNPVSPGIITSRINRSKCRPSSLARASLALIAVVTR